MSTRSGKTYQNPDHDRALSKRTEEQQVQNSVADEETPINLPGAFINSPARVFRRDQLTYCWAPTMPTDPQGDPTAGPSRSSSLSETGPTTPEPAPSVVLDNSQLEMLRLIKLQQDEALRPLKKQLYEFGQRLDEIEGIEDVESQSTTRGADVPRGRAQYSAQDARASLPAQTRAAPMSQPGFQGNHPTFQQQGTQYPQYGQQGAQHQQYGAQGSSAPSATPGPANFDTGDYMRTALARADDRLLKASTLGFLKPEKPRQFLNQLKIFGNQHSARALTHAFYESMNTNTNEEVQLWFNAVVASTDPIDVQRRETINGWIQLIEDTFSKTSAEAERHLHSIKYDWEEPVTKFVFKIRTAMAEMNKNDPAAVIWEIERRLPDEYKASPFNSLSTDKPRYETFLTELKAKELGAKHARDQRVQLTKALGYVTRNERDARPRYENRKKDDGGKSDKYKGKTAKYDKNNPPPCYCGKNHWRKDTPCNPSGARALAAMQVLLGELVDEYDADEDSRPDSSGSNSSGSSIPQKRSMKDEEEDAASSYFRPSNEEEHDTRSYLVTPVDDEPPITVMHARAEASTSGTQPARVVAVKPLGPALDEYSYKGLGPACVKVATSPTAAPKWRPLDTGSPVSLVSKVFLEAHYKTVLPVTKAKPLNLAGITAGRTISDAGAELDIYLPTRDNSWMKMRGYFHVVPELHVGILLGNDLVKSYQISVMADDTFHVGTANLTGHVSRQAPGMVRVTTKDEAKIFIASDTYIRPGTTKNVAVRLPARPLHNTVAVGLTRYDERDDSLGRLASVLLNADVPRQAALPYTNFGKGCIKLNKGDQIGFLEEVLDGDQENGQVFRLGPLKSPESYTSASLGKKKTKTSPSCRRQ